MRSIREGLAGFRRAPLLGSLSITSIGLSLLIIGLFALSAHNVDRALSDVEERVEVVGYLIEDAGEDRVRIARQEIAGYPEVDEVRYVSKVEALFDASRPASLELTFNEGFRDPDHVAAVAERLSTYEFIDDVRYGQGWVEKIFALRRLAGGGALILGGAFAGVAVLLIVTAVRMAILARSEEIEIMQTVGATEGYIQRPFLVEGLVTGLLGGGLALGLTRIGYVLITRSFLPLEWLPDLWIVGGIGAAGLLGMIAAGYAVRRELGKSYAL